MSSVGLIAVEAASKRVTFDDLHLGRSNQEVVCRILRFWDDRNVSRDGEFMGIVLLLIDDKNNLIHAFIRASLAVHHRRDLKDSAVVVLTNFYGPNIRQPIDLSSSSLSHLFHVVPSPKSSVIDGDSPSPSPVQIPHNT